MSVPASTPVESTRDESTRAASTRAAPTAAALSALLAEHMPSVAASGMRIDALDADEARVCLQPEARHLRPGGTVSGPTMMALADTAMYAAVLQRALRERPEPELLAVTTDLQMHFLRRPRPGAMCATARVLKFGQELVVLRVDITQGETLVAHATGTYARPPRA